MVIKCAAHAYQITQPDGLLSCSEERTTCPVLSQISQCTSSQPTSRRSALTTAAGRGGGGGKQTNKKKKQKKKKKEEKEKNKKKKKTLSKSEAPCNFSYNTAGRLSATAYSLYSQLPSTS
jgi:hypothetical protein